MDTYNVRLLLSKIWLLHMVTITVVRERRKMRIKKAIKRPKRKILKFLCQLSNLIK